jgi:hypothetical protein
MHLNIESKNEGRTARTNTQVSHVMSISRLIRAVPTHYLSSYCTTYVLVKHEIQDCTSATQINPEVSRGRTHNTHAPVPSHSFSVIISAQLPAT